MRTTRITTLLCVLGACFVLGACGDDDEQAPDSGGFATVTIQEETPEGGTGNGTPEPGSEGETTPKPEKTVEGLPSSTPEPGPPARFRVVITDDGIEANVESLPEGPSLEATVLNRSDELVPFNFFVTRRAVVGSGQIEAGEQVVVQMRNLLPGELIVTSPPGRRTTIEVTPK